MKTYVIGYTTFLEIVRRPLFWGVAAIIAVLLLISVFIPYFTLGEDIKMVKDQGLVAIMVSGLVLAIFAASVSIADEIDGKTALTLLSKPVSRQSFIVGKYAGIMAAIALLFLVLGIWFMGCVFLKFNYAYVAKETVDRPTLQQGVDQMVSVLPGLVLTYFQVAVLCALSVAFSTRFPLHLNVSACIVIYLIGHLAPLLVQASSQQQFQGVQFMARFFATVLPNLEFFNVGPAISTDVMVPWVGYVLPCLVYSALFTTIALLLALLMFEDRDLA